MLREPSRCDLRAQDRRVPETPAPPNRLSRSGAPEARRVNEADGAGVCGVGARALPPERHKLPKAQAPTGPRTGMHSVSFGEWEKLEMSLSAPPGVATPVPQSTLPRGPMNFALASAPKFALPSVVNQGVARHVLDHDQSASAHACSGPRAVTFRPLSHQTKPD
jgi:hypothetical protein